MNAAAQQLGLGLILSTLLITVPPMAGMWFNGVMGQYYGSNYLGGWNGAQQPVGSGANSGMHGIPNPVNNPVPVSVPPHTNKHPQQPTNPQSASVINYDLNPDTSTKGYTDKQTHGTYSAKQKF